MKRTGLLLGLGVAIAVLAGVAVIVRWAIDQDAETVRAPIDVPDGDATTGDVAGPDGDPDDGDAEGLDDGVETTEVDDPFGITDGHSRGRLIVVAEDVGSRVNARAEPGGAVAGSFGAGEQVTTTGRRATVDGVEWVEVNIGGDDPFRWVAAEFLAAADELAGDEEAEITEDFPLGTYAVVTADEGATVNVRNAPGGDVIGGYVDGETGLEATGRRAVVGGIEWAEFESPDRTEIFWMATQFAERVAEPEPDAAPTTTAEPLGE